MYGSKRGRLILSPSFTNFFFLFCTFFCIDIVIVSFWRETQQTTREKKYRPQYNWLFALQQLQKQYYNHWEIWRSYVKVGLLFLSVDKVVVLAMSLSTS